MVLVIGILSDTHLAYPDDRLERLLSVTLADAEVLLHTGDHVGDVVIEYLQWDEPRPYYGVAGNMDQGPAGRALPAQRVVSLDGTAIGMVHGWGSPVGLERRVAAVFGAAVPVIVYGHSHQKSVCTVGGRLLVNPGSAFLPRSGVAGGVAVLRTGDGVPRVEFREVGSGVG